MSSCTQAPNLTCLKAVQVRAEHSLWVHLDLEEQVRPRPLGGGVRGEGRGGGACGIRRGGASRHECLLYWSVRFHHLTICTRDTEFPT